MKATKLIGENIQGCTFSHELAPITLFIGDNATGKSARARAVRIALAGHDPRLGKRASDTFKLASASAMEVRMEFEDGQVNKARFWQEGRTISTKTIIPVVCPGILLDVADYFDRTKDERRKFLFSLACGSMRYDADMVAADFKQIEIEGHDASAEKAVAEAVGLLLAQEKQRVASGLPMDEYFANLIAKFKEAQSNAGTIARQMRGSIQAATNLAAQTPMEPPPPTLAADLASAREDLLTMTSSLEVKRNLASETRRAQAARRLAEQEAERYPEPTDESAPLEAALVTATKARDGVAYDEEMVYRSQREADTLTGKKVALEKQIATFEASIAGLNQRLTSHCPKCGAEPEHWSKELVAKGKSDLAEFRKGLTEAKAALADVDSQLGAARADVEEQRKKASEHAECERKVHDAKSVLDKERHRYATAKQMRAAAQRRLAETPEPDSEKVAQVGSDWENEIETLGAQIGRKREEIEQMEGLTRLATRIAAERANQERAKAELEAQESAEKVYKACLARLASLQENIINDGIKTFMAGASALTKEVLGFPLEFKDGDIGYYRKHIWVSHETLSGTEQHLAYTGLSLAFARNAPCRIVVIDEMGRLTQNNKLRLLSAVAGCLQRGWMDNFIGIDAAATKEEWFENLPDYLDSVLGCKFLVHEIK